MSSPGRLAMKSGRSWENSATACLRTRVNSACCDGGLIGKSRATVDSLCKSLAASDSKASARCFGRSCAVARYAVTNTRINTSSALGGGNSSPTTALGANASIHFTPSNTRPGVYPPSTTETGQARTIINMDQRLHDKLWLCIGKALALIAGFAWGLVTP